MNNIKIMKNCPVNDSFNEYILFNTTNKTKCKIIRTARGMNDTANQLKFEHLTPLDAYYNNYFDFRSVEPSTFFG